MTDTIDKNDPTRRDFLYITTAVFGATVAATAAWPLIHQLNPDASVSALSSVEADISSIPEGGSLKVAWRGKPVFIRRRTKEEINIAEKEDGENLPHPEKDEERVKNKEWLVVVGVCTHLGCSPKYHPEVEPKPWDASWSGGFFCPCHGSMFDMVGRVFKGVPAPTNLAVPPHYFDGNILTIGEDGGIA